MTREQIEYSLGINGFGTGSWITLENIFKYISLRNDRTIFVNPKTVQFFFSEVGDYVFIRYTEGIPIETELVVAPDGQSLVYHDGKNYLIPICSGGKIDSSDEEVGTFHDLISFECVVGLHYK